jgi:transposase
MEEMLSRPSYPTDLNDLEGTVVNKILGGPPKLGRPPRFERRAELGAIFYMVRKGGSWRLLPHDLPPWPFVDFRDTL